MEIRNNPRRRALAAAALVAALGIAEAAAAADKLSVGALRFTSHSAGFIALERGHFKNEGLDVEFRFFQRRRADRGGARRGRRGLRDRRRDGRLHEPRRQGRDQGGRRACLHEHKDVDGMAIMASTKAYNAGFTKPEQLKGKSLAMTQIGLHLPLSGRHPGGEVRLFDQGRHRAAAAQGGRDDRRVQVGPGRRDAHGAPHRQAPGPSRRGQDHRLAARLPARTTRSPCC